MEVKFEKTVLPYMKTITKQVQSQEQSQQLRLADTMPDIDNILTSWGQVILRSKEWRNGCVQISGGVAIHVLYMPKDEIQPKCVETWLPFQISYDIPQTQHDGVAIACPFLRSLDARTLSDRKMMIRATVGVSVDALIPEDISLYTPEKIPVDLQVLTNTYPVVIPMESGEQHFNMEEPLDISKGEQAVVVLRYNIEPVLLESKIISDKLVMRGNASIDLLYLDSDGMIQKLYKEIPFSQYTQLTGEYDTTAMAEICFAVTELELEQDNNDYVVKAGILAQYTIYDKKTITVCEDAYSPLWKIETVTESLQLPSVLDRKEQILQAETELALAGHQVLDVAFSVVDIYSEFENGLLLVKPSVEFQILSADLEGNLHSTVRKWEGNWKIHASPEIAANISAIADGAPVIVGQTIQIPMRLKLMCSAAEPIPMISSIQQKESIVPDTNRPSLILRRMGSDTLWEIAKNTGSTIDAIKQANNVQQEPDANQILLIPIN